MLANAPPLDRDVLAELKRGDEEALHRIVSSRFAPLTAEARAELHDHEFAAPRVVEQAFLRAWEERERFDTPEGLDAFLVDAVHRGALREKGRRAAVHRIEAHEGVRDVARRQVAATEDPEEAWQHVSHALHAGERRHELEAQRAGTLRHDAAVHVASVAKRPSLLGPALFGIALIILFAGIWTFDRAGAGSIATRALSSEDVRTVSSQPGQMGVVTLDDGSQVTLGPDTHLRIAPETKNVAAYAVNGTATFTVAPRDGRRFEVRAGPAAIVVTGTKFTVRGYDGDAAVIVQVAEGTVDVTTKASSRELSAESAIAIAPDGTIRDPSPAEVQRGLAWTSGRYAVEGRAMKDVVADFRRWYGREVTLAEPALGDRLVTVDVPLDSPGEAIEGITTAAKLRLEYEGKKAVLRDAGGAR